MIGRGTRERIVSAKSCPALAGHGIALCGVSDASPEFTFVRFSPHFAQLLACVRGWGEVMIDERMTRCPAGMAYLTPRRKPHAYHARSRGRWQVAWIHYAEQDMRGPELVQADAASLASAISGLYRESVGSCEAGVMANWATLVATLSKRIIGSTHIDPRLQQLWEAVDSDLAHAWDSAQCAAIAQISAEHLRRLSLAQMNMTPMRYLARLRMRRADALLRTGAYSVQAVAALVGYEDAFAFSTAFPRHFGFAPSHAIAT